MNRDQSFVVDEPNVYWRRHDTTRLKPERTEAKSTHSIPKLKASKADTISSTTQVKKRRKKQQKIVSASVPPPAEKKTRAELTGIRERRPIRRGKKPQDLPPAPPPVQTTTWSRAETSSRGHCSMDATATSTSRKYPRVHRTRRRNAMVCATGILDSQRMGSGQVIAF
ncbi:expressed unknown protein [Seminavis robusta]|uniref:Uncharacterized protein n=1 Tax=Seminavis robusta TaxID=568900 RepID=A0A9N8HR39_9STRA|nr:expressed unknown protein [Seminavis robusta]|eukprot:Sro1224_g253990.1 n/a (168) ;mRNA; r:16650-17153